MQQQPPQGSWSEQLMAALAKLDWQQVRDQHDVEAPQPCSAKMPAKAPRPKSTEAG